MPLLKDPTQSNKSIIFLSPETPLLSPLPLESISSFFLAMYFPPQHSSSDIHFDLLICPSFLANIKSPQV